MTPGDFIQFAGGNSHNFACIPPKLIGNASAVSLSLCPGAPQVGFMMGRPLPLAPAPGPDGLVPEPFGRYFAFGTASRINGAPR